MVEFFVMTNFCIEDLTRPVLFYICSAIKFLFASRNILDNEAPTKLLKIIDSQTKVGLEYEHVGKFYMQLFF